MCKYAYLQDSGSTPQFCALMSGYAWLGVGPTMRAGRVDHPASPPTSQHGTLGDFWLMATMATMATLGADLLKNLHLENLVGWLSPPPHNLPLVSQSESVTTTLLAGSSWTTHTLLFFFRVR